jgi:hypothetical protein
MNNSYVKKYSLPLPTRVNKFGECYRNSPKFNGFGPHRILKLTILLFIDSKYFKK